MALLTRYCRMQERPATVFGRPPKLLVHVGEVLAEVWLCVSAKGRFAKTRTGEVHDNSRTRYGYQVCEIADRDDPQELGQCVSSSSWSVWTGSKGRATFQLHSRMDYVRLHHRHIFIVQPHQGIVLDLIPLCLRTEA